MNDNNNHNNNKVLINEIQQTVPDDTKVPYNILPFGDIGLGKSSFLNTLLKAFTQGRGFVKYALTFPEGHKDAPSSVTKTFESFRIPNTNIELWDTYGWERTAGNYTPQVFKNYVLGKIPRGTARPAKGAEVEDRNQSKGTEIQTVIFFLPAELAQEAKRQQLIDLWKNMREYYQVTVQCGIKSLFVLSQLDKNPNFKDIKKQSFVDTFSNPNWNSVLTTVTSVLSADVPFPRIFPLQTYLSSELEVLNLPNIEEYSLRVLRLAVSESLSPMISDSKLGEPQFWAAATQFQNEAPVLVTLCKPTTRDDQQEVPEEQF